MSRVSKKPVIIPSGVEVKIHEGSVTVKGPKGALEMKVHPGVGLTQEGDQIQFEFKRKEAHAMAGTMRSLFNNMVLGVSSGFERKLELVGVGYRAQAQGKNLNLTLGYSHAIDFPVPDGITINTPNQTQIVVQGIDKQKVGQVAAELRAFRPPEPYKGKGVKYAGEQIVRKEAKKK